MRVIGGSLRGRPLKAPKGSQTRPTKDNVREAWFNILGNVRGTNVLEVFAGTGALGIEALSRGAQHAVFVESWSAAQKALQDNLTRLALTEQSTLVKTRVERSHARLRELGPFDLVLADPPWTDLQRSLFCLTQLIRSDLLVAHTRLYVGHPSGYDFVPAVAGLTLTDRRAWGDSGASLFEWVP